MAAVPRSAVGLMAVIAVVAGVASRSKGEPPPLVLPEVTRSQTPPAGWRIEGTGGAQILVPAEWTTNDYGCGMGEGPTVERAHGMQSMCLTPESPRKEVAFVNAGHGQDPAARKAEKLKAVPVEVAGLAARRAEGRLPDGRHAGWIEIPALEFTLSVRTLRAEVTRKVLDSLRFVGVDANGCPVNSANGPRRPSGAPRDSFVMAEPVSVSVCYYNGGGMTGWEDERGAFLRWFGPGGGLPIDASARLGARGARALAAAFNRAEPIEGANECTDGAQAMPDTILTFEDASGRRSSVFASFQGCEGEGLDNGRGWARLEEDALVRFMDPLHVGHTF